MKDLMSTGLTKLATTSKEKFAAIQSNINATIVKNDALATSFQNVNKSASLGGMFGGLKSIVGVLGFTAVLGGVAEMAHAGIEKVHALHQSSAALINTMKNMGTYSEEAFEKAGKGADELRQKTGFNKASIIDLQSQLRLVGNIGDTEMNRMIAVSADMATKFHMGLNEAGNALAKAVNNPEMMRRLAMQLKIDPKIVEHIQQLAKDGKEAQARLELIAIAEQKVGGAAAAAFNADENALYNLSLEDLQIKLGEVATEIKVAVLPYAIKFLEWVKEAVIWIEKNGAEIWTWIKGLGAAALAFKTATMFIIPLIEGFTAIGPAAGAAAVGMETAGAAATVALGPLGLIALAIAGITAAWISAKNAEDQYNQINADNLKSVYKNEQESIGGMIKSLKEKYHLTDSEATGRILKGESDSILSSIRDNMNKINAAQEAYDAMGAGVGAKTRAAAFQKLEGLKQVANDLAVQKKAADDFKNTGVNAANIKGGKASTIAGSDSGKDVAKGITSGGPRVINISIGKMVEKLEIHASNIADGLDGMEKKVQEVFLRILNSGASVQ